VVGVRPKWGEQYNNDASACLAAHLRGGHSDSVRQEGAEGNGVAVELGAVDRHGPLPLSWCSDHSNFTAGRAYSAPGGCMCMLPDCRACCSVWVVRRAHMWTWQVLVWFCYSFTLRAHVHELQRPTPAPTAAAAV
jgi:hypothetical protein